MTKAQYEGGSEDKKDQMKKESTRTKLSCTKRILPYISRKEMDNIKQYKYQCADNGVTYVYFFSPLCNKLVNCLPMWLAANMITLIGMLFALVPPIYAFANYGMCFRNEKDNAPPQYFWAIQAVCYFMYRLMDETDGK